jgi:spore coat polysaccharide biosynthesis protein SpsF
MNGRRGSTVAIVQARTTSSRLPGKVLMDIHGAPMILRQLDRLKRAQSIDHIVVATSVDASDDDLAGIVQGAGYSIVRGSLDDVLDRFIQVIDDYHPDVVVRITADCPLMSPSVIDQVVQAFHASDAAYLSNTMMPTYPDGLDVEVVLADALRKVSVSSTDPQEREHVTLGVYRHPEHFAVENFVDPTGADHSDLRWTVDNSGDLNFVTRVYDALFPLDPGFDYPDILALLKGHPEWSRTESDARRNAALDGLDTGAMHHQESQVQP